MVVLSPRDESLPDDTEARLTDFTELVAAAIANAETRAALAELADEQAALRRVATLVAEAAPPAEISSAVSMSSQTGIAEFHGAPSFGSPGPPFAMRQNTKLSVSCGIVPLWLYASGAGVKPCA